MHRMGLLEHISRFDRRYGNREGWILSDHFEKSLAQLVHKTISFKSTEVIPQADEERLLNAVESARGSMPQSPRKRPLDNPADHDEHREMKGQDTIYREQ